MKIGLIYFSATKNTAKIAEIIKSEMVEIGIDAEIVNITPYKTRQATINFDSYDGLVFGFPVYGSVIPSVCREWVVTLQGKDKPCAMYFTYGGPTMGIAHYHTKLLLNKQGFKVLASAEFLGKHSFNVAKGFDLLPDRPNDHDFNIAEDYARKLNELFLSKTSQEITLDKPEIADKIMERVQNPTKRVVEHPPTRDGKDCSMCRTCEDNCPTEAFNADTGEADGEKCIQCMGCVVNCSDQVIKFHSDMTELSKKLLDYYSLTDESVTKLESKIVL